jgi:hypothetical protein
MASTNIFYENELTGDYLCFTCAVKVICMNSKSEVKTKTDVYDSHKCHICQKFLNDKIEI